MHLVISHFLTAARYERKLVFRNRFFQIFSLGVVLYTLVTCMYDLSDASGANWTYRAVPSTFPYLILLYVSAAETVLCVFLASSSMKREKQFDSSCVFQIRPVSGLCRMAGILWGDISALLSLNMLVLCIVLIFNVTQSSAGIDWFSYLFYFILLGPPSFVFMLGCAAWLYLLMRNQAITVLLLLGYIALVCIHVGSRYFGIFDCAAFSLPWFRSEIIGNPAQGLILWHQVVYLVWGIAFILLVSVRFGNPTYTLRGKKGIRMAGVCCAMIALLLMAKPVAQWYRISDERQSAVEANELHASDAVWTVHQYQIEIKQLRNGIQATARFEGSPQTTDRRFIFRLNPGLNVSSVQTANGTELAWSRNGHLLLVDFGSLMTSADTGELVITYHGVLQESSCYLDIATQDFLDWDYLVADLVMPSQSFIQTPRCCVFTPESSWYPRPGTAPTANDIYRDQDGFSWFDLRVLPRAGLMPVAQGALLDTLPGWYRFRTEMPIPSLSLCIADYESVAVDTAGICYTAYYIKGHDYFNKAIRLPRHKIAGLLSEVTEDFERVNRLRYPYRRFAVVEVPATFRSFDRPQSTASEWTQPEMQLVAEKGIHMPECDFAQQLRRRKRYFRDQYSDEEYQQQVLLAFLKKFTSSGSPSGSFVTSQRPQLFDFVYNVFSPDIPFSRQTVSKYLDLTANPVSYFNAMTAGARRPGESASDEIDTRQFEGMSSGEALAAIRYDHHLAETVIRRQAELIFAWEQAKEASCDTCPLRLAEMLSAKPFENIRFEELLHTLDDSTGLSITELMARGFVKDVPEYLLQEPEKRLLRNESGTYYEVSETVSNDSPHDGMVLLMLQYGVQAYDYYPVTVPAHTSRKVVMVSGKKPDYLIIRHLQSGNLPGMQRIRLGPDNTWGAEIQEQMVQSRTLPCEHPAMSIAENEILADNEDSLRFSLTRAPVPRTLLRSGKTMVHSRYDERRLSFSALRPPASWSYIVNQSFHGRYRHSAYVVRSTHMGAPEQTATWTLPVSQPGMYEIFYHVWPYDDAYASRNNRQGTYRFQITQEGMQTSFSLTLNEVKEPGWQSLGTCTLHEGDVAFSLTNDSELRYVVADAVRLVKRPKSVAE